jgi:mono/diheme cytochrome c family protein
VSASLLFAALLVVAAKPDVEAKGRWLFNNSAVGKNGIACSSCHSVVEDEEKDGDGLLRAGHSLWGVAARPYWRGDARKVAHPTLKDAVDVCVQVFQGGNPLEPEDARLLVAYLQSISPKKPQPPLQIQPALEATLDYHREKYQGGDADRGRGLFFRACHGCHPRGAAGLGPGLTGTAPDAVARAVREGNGLLRGARRPGAWAPFFGKDRLNDQQVADVAAFVSSLQAPAAEVSK